MKREKRKTCWNFFVVTVFLFFFLTVGRSRRNSFLDNHPPHLLLCWLSDAVGWFFCFVFFVFLNVVPSSEKTIFLSTFCGSYFSHIYTLHITFQPFHNLVLIYILLLYLSLIFSIFKVFKVRSLRLWPIAKANQWPHLLYPPKLD